MHQLHRRIRPKKPISACQSIPADYSKLTASEIIRWQASIRAGGHQAKVVERPTADGPLRTAPSVRKSVLIHAPKNRSFRLHLLRVTVSTLSVPYSLHRQLRRHGNGKKERTTERTNERKRKKEKGKKEKGVRKGKGIAPRPKIEKRIPVPATATGTGHRRPERPIDPEAL